MLRSQIFRFKRSSVFLELKYRRQEGQSRKFPEFIHTQSSQHTTQIMLTDAWYSYGLFTFARWAGCFSPPDRVWQLPVTLDELGKMVESARHISIKLVENAAIIVFGISYVILQCTGPKLYPRSSLNTARFSTDFMSFAAGIVSIVLSNKECQVRFTNFFLVRCST